MRDCLDQVSLQLFLWGIVLIVLIAGGGWEDTLRMWMVPFHGLGAELDEEESGLITCKHVPLCSLL